MQTDGPHIFPEGQTNHFYVADLVILSLNVGVDEVEVHMFNVWNNFMFYFSGCESVWKDTKSPRCGYLWSSWTRLTLIATCATCAAWAPSKISLAWIYFQEWKGTQSCWPSSIVSHRYRFVHQLHWLVCHSFRMLIHLLNEITCHPISLCEVKASLVNHIHRIFKAEPDCAGHEENAEEWKKIILIKLFLVWVVFYDFEARVFLRYGLRMAEAHSWKMFAITNQPFWR